MGEIVVCAILSAVYPTLIAATTVMLLLPKAEKLMFGFWAGAMITSVACGLVIVFVLGADSNTAKTARHTLSPVLDLVMAVLLVFAAIALAKGEDQRERAKYAAAHPRDPVKKPKWRQELESGNPWHAFAIGIVLSFPGVWYLAALDRLNKLHYSDVAEVIVVVVFCVAQLALIEIPMLAFKIWPEQTPIAIDNAKAAVARHGRHYAVVGLEIVAALLVIRGVIGLVA